MYSRHTKRIQPCISALWSEVQIHLRSTLLSKLMVSDLTGHAYSIQRPMLTSCHLLLTYDPTPGRPLNSVYLLCIILEQLILLNSKLIFFVPECFESVAVSTQSAIFQPLDIVLQVRLIPLGPSKYLNLCVTGIWRLLLKCTNCDALCHSSHWKKVPTTHLP